MAGDNVSTADCTMMEDELLTTDWRAHCKMPSGPNRASIHGLHPLDSHHGPLNPRQCLLGPPEHTLCNVIWAARPQAMPPGP